MKIDNDAPLNRYLVKHLQPLTEADPTLLGNYVVALLKNNKPKKELQKLCIEQLYDFLGEGTKVFVVKLFHALEDGTIQASQDEKESSMPTDTASVPVTGDVTEPRSSPPRQLEKAPSSIVRAFSDQEEGTDDEDDDRNHKHRRRVTRSRSFDRDDQDDDDRGPYRKRNRLTESGQQVRENNDHPISELPRGSVTVQMERETSVKYERRLSRDQGYGSVPRLNTEGNQRGALRGGPTFRGEVVGSRFDSQNGIVRGPLGRGRGGSGGPWPSHEQRYSPFDGPDFNQSLLPPGPPPPPPPPPSIYPGRAMPTRGNPLHSPWGGFGHLSGMVNGSLDQVLPLNAGIQGARAVPISPSIGVGINMGIGITIGRPRCPDFEERGFCLRGDLCPMEHGANRIVVEDVQSLSQFNLPGTLPTGRGIGIGSGPLTTPLSAPPPSSLALSSRALRDTLDEPGLSNGIVPSNVAAEPDLYDPDQPLWNKDRPDVSGGMRRLPTLRKGQDDHDWESGAPDRRRHKTPDDGETERHARVAAGGLQGGQPGSSVWDRIGPVDRSESRGDGAARAPIASVEGPHRGKLPRKDTSEDQLHHCRTISGQGIKLESEPQVQPDVEEENTSKASTANVSHGKGLAAIRGDVGTRSIDGTSYGPRPGGGHRGTAGSGTERAQRTLYISCIPINSNRRELLLAHFQKFGEVVDVRNPVHTDRAFVQFSRREDAEAALLSPEAVMGNRFIRLSWANRDSIADSGETNMSLASNGRAVSGGSVIATQVPPVKGREKVGGRPAAVEVNATENTGKPTAANNLPSSSVAMAQKKQEELEHMKEEIRRKQEVLAQKRDDFRRKLDQLSRQGAGTKGDTDTEQSSKNSKSEEREGSNVTLCKLGSFEATAMSTAAEPAGQSSSEHSSSTMRAQKPIIGDTPKLVSGLSAVNAPQPSSMRSPFPRPGVMVWGPARYKLDNRTTVFRVLPPFPDGLMDIATMKEHFASFGELSSIELEDTEGQKQEGNLKLTQKSVVRATFASRRAAERAFIQGRWFHGLSLQLAWSTSAVNSSGSITPTGSRQVDITSKENASPQFPGHSTGAALLMERGVREERKAVDGDGVRRIEDMLAGEDQDEREALQLTHEMGDEKIHLGQAPRVADSLPSDVSMKLGGDNSGIHTDNATVKTVL